MIHPPVQPRRDTPTCTTTTRYTRLYNHDAQLEASVCFLNQALPRTGAPVWPSKFFHTSKVRLLNKKWKSLLHSPHFLNSSNFQHFELISVKSLMNVEWIPEKEAAAAGTCGDRSPNSTRVKQEMKSGGGPRVTQEPARGTATRATPPAARSHGNGHGIFHLECGSVDRQ